MCHTDGTEAWEQQIDHLDDHTRHQAFQQQGAQMGLRQRQRVIEARQAHVDRADKRRHQQQEQAQGSRQRPSDDRLTHDERQAAPIILAQKEPNQKTEHGTMKGIGDAAGCQSGAQDSPDEPHQQRRPRTQPGSRNHDRKWQQRRKRRNRLSRDARRWQQRELRKSEHQQIVRDQQGHDQGSYQQSQEQKQAAQI